MTIMDRYLARLFVKVLLIFFISLSGLYMVIDIFGNLEEFLEHGEKQGGLVHVLMQYYAPRVVSFFDRTSGVLALVAGMFTISWLRRNNEMAALMAAGISKLRIVAPLLVGGLAVSLVAAASREWVIPQFRDQLSRNAQSWGDDQAQPMRARWDNQTNIFFQGRDLVRSEKKITSPSFLLPTELHVIGEKTLAAKAAYYRAATDDAPAGYLFTEVTKPERIADRQSVAVEGEPVILCPGDTPWLKQNECFVISDITFRQLEAGNSWQQYASTRELIAGLHNPSLDYGAGVRVSIHARLLQPLLDMSLMLVGLPVLLSRGTKNLSVTAGQSLLILVGFFVVVMACHSLGSNYLISPAQAAWCPLVIFGAAAAYSSEAFFK